MIDFPAKMRIFGRMNTLGINKAPKDTRRHVARAFKINDAEVGNET